MAGCRTGFPAVNPHVDITNNDNRTHTTNGGVSITADYNLDWATLTSISAWRMWDFHPPQDSDASPIDIYDNEAISRDDQFSEELRLASDSGGSIEWQTGVFLWYSKLKDHYQVHQFGADVIPWYDAYKAVIGTPVSATFAPIPISFASQLTGAQIIEDTTVQNQDAAVYGQATWHIDDQFDLTGGLRTPMTARARQPGRYEPSPPDPSRRRDERPAEHVLQRNRRRLQESGRRLHDTWLSGWRRDLGLSAQRVDIVRQCFPARPACPTRSRPDILTYVAFSNGFQAGGLDLNNGSAIASQVAVNPTTTDNYEIGVKSELFDDRLILNITAYNEVLYGFQTSISYLLPNGTSYRGATNAGNIRARGIEWDATAVLGDGVGVTFDGAYNDAIYQKALSLPARRN